MDNSKRKKILDIISECSSNKVTNEGCSLEYTKINWDRLFREINKSYNTDINMINVPYYACTNIRQLIDFIIRLLPIVEESDSISDASYSYSTSHSYSTSQTGNFSISKSETISTSSPNTSEKTIKMKNITNIAKKQYEYIIGIDLGHGETSAAICPLQWSSPVEQLEPAKDLELGGNKKVIPSAITILDNGTAYIGDSAFNPEILKQADVHVCFKKAPKDIKGNAEKIMIRYMQEVYRRIRENNSAMLTDNNHLVYIATPSGWDKTTQDLYLQMAEQAGLPIAGVTKESRAAFVRAQHDVTSGIGKYIEKGAVVFDMGSSTLDFTYMSSSRKLIDHGYDCGASFIEKTIFNQCEEKDESIHRFEGKYPRLMPYLLFEARKVKEQVYFDPSLKVKKTINFEDFIDDEDFEDDRFKIVYQPGELNSLLEHVGYIKNIENAARDFVSTHINGAPIYGVFLTGGASRMDFIKPLVSKCWNVPESQIYRDQDPSLTISQGVAEVARMDLRTEDMDDGLEEAINQLQKNDVIYNSFIEKFGYALWDRITDEVGGTITSFRDADSDYSLYDLQTSITNNVQGGIEEIIPQITAFMQEAISENTSEIQQKVENIITHYSNQGINIPKPELNIRTLNTGNINLNNILDSISEKIASESANWAGAITGAAIGGAIAFLLGGPLAWIVGGAAFLGQLFLGKSEEERKRDAMQKELDKDDRQKVFDSIVEKWDDIQEDIKNSVYNSISRNIEIKQSINQTTFQLLQSYKESLKKARILID